MRKFLWIVIVGLVATIVWLSFSYNRKTHRFESLPVGNISLPAFTPQFPSLGFGTLTQPTTVLFMGVDVVYSGQGRALQADKTALNGRSDTMMLVFLNPPNNKISVLNIPRDTEAQIGKLGVQKINSANALGGPEYAKAAVINLLGTQIDHYCVMNLQGLVQLVNELGGVTVEVPKKMSYMDWTAKLKIDLDPGVHTLTGNQSMGFVRFRHDDMGDIGRVQRQQIFLQAAQRKMLDPRSWVHVPALVDIAQKNINTDMSQMELFQALNFAHGVPKENIKFVMLPGQFSANGDWIATSDAKTLAWSLANPDQQMVSSRRNINICIKNASDDPTLGGKLSMALHKLGYMTGVGKDEKDSIYKRSRIIVQNGNDANGNMIKADLGGVGDVVNASLGNLMTQITIIACNDIDLTKIQQSSVDAPYVQPVVPRPIITPIGAPFISKRLKRSQMNPADADLMLDGQPTPSGTEGSASPSPDMQSSVDSGGNPNTYSYSTLSPATSEASPERHNNRYSTRYSERASDRPSRLQPDLQPAYDPAAEASIAPAPQDAQQSKPVTPPVAPRYSTSPEPQTNSAPVPGAGDTTP